MTDIVIVQITDLKQVLIIVGLIFPTVVNNNKVFELTYRNALSLLFSCKANKESICCEETQTLSK